MFPGYEKKRIMLPMGEIKSHFKIVALAGMVAALAGSASAEVSVTLDFATGYSFRGFTFDSFVFQPGIEASGLGLPEKYGSALVGVWGSFDMNDSGGTADSSEFSEIDWYASYSLPGFIDGLDLFVGFIEYTFPNSEYTADKEANLGIGYEIAGIALGATAYLGVGGDVNGNAYYDLWTSYAFAVSDELEVSVGAAVGYLDLDAGSAGWNDGVFDLSASYALGEVWSVGASVAYIAQFGGAVLDGVDEGIDSDGNVIGMLSFGAFF